MARAPDVRMEQARELFPFRISGKIDINGIATLQKRNATLRKQRKAVSQVTRMP